MGDSNSPSVKNVASSLASLIATRPILALIVILTLLLLVSGASGYFINQRAMAEKIQALKDQARDYEGKMERMEKEYLAVVTPIIAEREALKKRLAGAVKPRKPPKDDKEMIERFGKLGY